MTLFGSNYRWWEEREMENSVRHAPDEEWCADTLIKLTRGVTAYRLEMPEICDDAAQDHIPLVLCFDLS